MLYRTFCHQIMKQQNGETPLEVKWDFFTSEHLWYFLNHDEITYITLIVPLEPETVLQRKSHYSDSYTLIIVMPDLA